MKIVSWLDGLGGASLDQIRRRFCLGRTQGYRRLQVLRRYGLIRRSQPLVGLPALYAVRGRLVRPWAFQHTLLLTDLIVDLELAHRTVLGEVAIRRWRIDDTTHAAQPLTTEQQYVVSGCGRIPDAIELREEGSLVAYEVELASKGRRRREEILAMYAASDYTLVEWLVPELQLARLIRQEIAEMRLDDFMCVTRSARL